MSNNIKGCLIFHEKEKTLVFKEKEQRHLSLSYTFLRQTSAIPAVELSLGQEV